MLGPSKVWVDAAEFTDDLKVGCEVWLKEKMTEKKIWLGGYDVFGVGEIEGVYIYIYAILYICIFICIYVYIICIMLIIMI